MKRFAFLVVLVVLGCEVEDERRFSPIKADNVDFIDEASDTEEIAEIETIDTKPVIVETVNDIVSDDPIEIETFDPVETVGTGHVETETVDTVATDEIETEHSDVDPETEPEEIDTEPVYCKSVAQSTVDCGYDDGTQSYNNFCDGKFDNYSDDYMLQTCGYADEIKGSLGTTIAIITTKQFTFKTGPTDCYYVNIPSEWDVTLIKQTDRIDKVELEGRTVYKVNKYDNYGNDVTVFPDRALVDIVYFRIGRLGSESCKMSVDEFADITTGA